MNMLRVFYVSLGHPMCSAHLIVYSYLS